MMTTREALEAALVADPDDTALHAAYADLLIEDGDPRGEYIRLSLMAEDRDQPANQLSGIEQAMFDLRRRHESAWLGPLARFLDRRQARSVAEPMEPNVGIAWRRGWIDAIHIGQLTQELVTAIADCPLTRLLGELSIERNRADTLLAGAPEIDQGLTADYDDFEAELNMAPLVEAGRFRALRVFKLGSFVDGVLASGWELEEYLADAKRLEEVRICSDWFSAAFLFGGELPRLHTLHITGNHYRLPFSLLGYNDRLPNLRTLFLDSETFRNRDDSPAGDRRELDESDFLCLHRPGCLPVLESFTLRDDSVRDAGLRLLTEAPFFTRLTRLDLSRCGITDEGAELLANHPHARRLESLRLDYNYLSPIGVEALDAIGVTVGDQLFGPPNRREWDAFNEDGGEWELDLDDLTDNDPPPGSAIL